MNHDTLAVVAGTAELMGQPLSKTGLKMLASDLSRFKDEDIVTACERLRMQGGKFSLQNIAAHIPGQHAGPEEAWALASITDAESSCVTQQMMTAWGEVSHLDKVAGRLAFKEIYQRLVSEQKLLGNPPKWFITAGTSKELLEQCALKATHRGQISVDACQNYLPRYSKTDLIALSGRKIDAKALQYKQQGIERIDKLEESAMISIGASKELKAKGLLEIGKLRAMLELCDTTKQDTAA